MTRVAAVGAAALVLALAAVGVWLGFRGGSSTASARLGPTTTGAAGPVTPVGPISLDGPALKARAGTLGQDVYWLGPESTQRYELERTAAGEVFIRYIGSKTAVGTYPLTSAYAATQAQSHRDGWAQEHVEAWLVAYPTSSSATTVYLAAQSFPYQIEVYDPVPGRARSLVESGAVGPVR
jgi:hypothetical protein